MVDLVCATRRMKEQAFAPSYKRHRFAPEISGHAVWRYCRCALRNRDVAELLAARGAPDRRDGAPVVLHVRAGRRAYLAPSAAQAGRQVAPGRAGQLHVSGGDQRGRCGARRRPHTQRPPAARFAPRQAIVLRRWVLTTQVAPRRRVSWRVSACAALLATTCNCPAWTRPSSRSMVCSTLADGRSTGTGRCALVHHSVSVLDFRLA